MTALRVGIVGAGGIGKRRAAALGREAMLVAVADIDTTAASLLAAPFICSTEALLELPHVDAVIVSTPHAELAGIAASALKAGKHVLVEKPGAVSLREMKALRAVADESRCVLRVGCNHRFHPALQRARHWLAEGLIGRTLNIRARYGHGGRRGYESEWRANPVSSGGGELIDQGVHLIDLCNWLVGTFELEWADISTQFWQMPVEDNATLVLRRGPVRALLSLSCTEWRNLFEFEVFGELGKVEVTGLGRSYGLETARLIQIPATGTMWPPAVDKTFEYPGPDESWRAEWLGFVRAIEENTGPAGPTRTDNATVEDAERAMRIVHEAYERCGASWLRGT